MMWLLSLLWAMFLASSALAASCNAGRTDSVLKGVGWLLLGGWLLVSLVAHVVVVNGNA